MLKLVFKLLSNDGNVYVHTMHDVCPHGPVGDTCAHKGIRKKKGRDHFFFLVQRSRSSNCLVSGTGQHNVYVVE